MSEEDITYPHECATNKVKHKMDGLLRGLDLNNVVIEKRSRNNSESSHSVSGEASSKKKSNITLSETTKINKHRKSSNEIILSRVIEEQEDSQEDNCKAKLSQNLKEVKEKNSIEETNSQRRKLRSSGKEIQNEVPNIQSKKHQKISTKLAQHTEKIMNQKVQQEQSAFNLNNSNEDGLSSTSCSSDLLKKTRKKSSHEVEPFNSHQSANNVTHSAKQEEKQIEKKRKTSDFQQVELPTQQSKTVSKDKNKPPQSKQEDVKLQGLKKNTNKDTELVIDNQRIQTRQRLSSDEYIKKQNSAEKQFPLKKETLHKKEQLSTSQINQNQRDIRAQKRELIKKQELEEKQQQDEEQDQEEEQQKISSEEEQIKEPDQLKVQNKLENKSESQASKKGQVKNHSQEHSKIKQVSFKEKISEIIGEDAVSVPVKGSFISAYDYNVHQDSDSEKDYFPSKKALKNHKKEKRIKKRQENKLEIAIKKTQKLLQSKNQQIKLQRTIITVEIPSESSFDDEDEVVNEQNNKQNQFKGQKSAFFSKKLNDLDKTNSYKSKKFVQQNDSNYQIVIEGKKTQQMLESSENNNGKNKQNESPNQQKNTKNLSQDNLGQKSLSANRQTKTQSVSDEDLKPDGEKIEKNQNAFGKHKNIESKTHNNQQETLSKQKNQKKQQIHSTNQQVKAENELKDKQIKKKQTYTKTLQNQMNFQNKQFQNSNHFNSEIGNTQTLNQQEKKETGANQPTQKAKISNQSDFSIEGSSNDLCSFSSLLIIEEDKQVKGVNNDPHILSQDQNNQISNTKESLQTRITAKRASQDDEQSLQNENKIQAEEEEIQDNQGSNSQHITGAEQDNTGQVEVNQSSQKSILYQQRQIQNENRKRDVNNPYFYDPKIDFINTNIFFKNFFTEFQPQERKTFYQKVAYQHHLLSSQHTISQQTILPLAESQEIDKNTQFQTATQQNEQQKEDQSAQTESQNEEKLFKQQLNLEQKNYLNHTHQLNNIYQNDNFVKNSNTEENHQNLNQTNKKGEKDIDQQNEMQIEEQALCQQDNPVTTEQEDEEIKELKKKPIGILAHKSKESGEHMIELQSELDLLYEKYYPSQTYINCDLKYFNLELIIKKTGLFDIIYMDPPWRIKGGQQFDSQFMFSNSKFSLDYDTMSNKEIMDIPVEKLSKKGFLFLWILNTQMNTAIQMMQKWGYNLVDKIVWVKMKDKNVYLSHGYYFMHSFELCLIGYKNDCRDDLSNLYPPSTPFSVIDESIQEENKMRGLNKRSEINLDYPHFFNKISNNVIFAEVRKKSQKPDEIYEIIDLMIPGAKKIELFARNNNLRPGWVSVGNQLGETYEKWTHQVNCDKCHQEIVKGKLKRYKSRKINNYDICEICVQSFDKKDFYEIQNKVNEDILHNYQSCNRCEAEPIWGIRFHCMVCKDFDLCEACVDENTKLSEGQQFHSLQHDMKIIEVPVFADGFPVHDRKCQSCFMSPIIGTCFTCKQCSGNFNLCQNCYFSKPIETIKNKRHRPEHQMDALISPIKNVKTKKIQFKCAGCGVLNLKDMYKCENCYGFYFCLPCYETKRDDFKTYMASSHKNYHQLIRYNLEEIEAQNEQKLDVQNTLNQPENKDNENGLHNSNILNVISQILDNEQVNNISDSLRCKSELKNHQRDEEDNNDRESLKKQTGPNEQIELLISDSKIKKNGQTKRPYNRKQKAQKKEDQEVLNEENKPEEQQNQKQNVEQDDQINKDEQYDQEQKQETVQDAEKAEEDQSNIVKKIRKKRVSKKQKLLLLEQQQKEEQKEDQQIAENTNLEQKDKQNEEDVSHSNKMEEEEDQKEESNKNSQQEDENKDKNVVVKKRKRRTKLEIEKFRQEKEQRDLEYLIGLRDGKEKKKRGRLPKLKGYTKEEIENNFLLSQNEQHQINDNIFLQTNNTSDQFNNKQQNEYNQKLIQDQLLLESLSNQPQQLVAQLQQNLMLIESYQQQKINSETDNTAKHNNNDLYFLADINQASDSKENTLNIQFQNQLNQNKISNFNYSNQDKQPIQNPFEFDLLQNLLNQINRNSIQQSNHSYNNEDNTIQYNNSVEKSILEAKDNQSKDNLINQSIQEQIHLDDNIEDCNDEESYESSSSSS